MYNEQLNIEHQLEIASVHFRFHGVGSEGKTIHLGFSIMVIFVLLATVVLATLAQTGEKSPPKVAVIGGGIGGTSVAYFLSQRLPGADVTVFEMGRVGGRLDTVDIAGRRYEVGGSIIHSANKLMVDYLEICNLTKKEGKGDEGGGNGAFSLIKEGKVVFQESENFYINSLRMIWR